MSSPRLKVTRELIAGTDLRHDAKRRPHDLAWSECDASKTLISKTHESLAVHQPSAPGVRDPARYALMGRTIPIRSREQTSNPRKSNAHYDV